jgi:phosphonate transport system substrate-binding protein
MANEDDLVNGLVANKVDLAWFSGLDFIQAKLRSNEQVIPIVQRVEDAQTRSVFVTARVDIAGLEDLKGRTFAFGAETSVSDHLMPRAFMREAFVDPDIEMKHVVYAGSPDVVVAAVSGGKVDAGVLSAAAWERMLANGKANAKVLHVFYTTPGYSDFNWTVRADMDANLRRELTSAFLSLDGGIGLDREILDLQRASRFIPADAENYTVIETVARSAGLLK